MVDPSIKCNPKVNDGQGRGGGQVVNVLAFYSNDLSSNPAGVYSFFL